MQKKRFIPETIGEEDGKREKPFRTEIPTEEEEGRDSRSFYLSIVMEKSKEEQEDSLSDSSEDHTGQFHCEICGDWFSDTIPFDQHHCGLVHQYNSAARPKKSYHLKQSNRGYQMLKSMDWEEDEGLGARGQGRLDPIPTSLKSDRKGVGAPQIKPKAITHSKPNEIPEAQRPRRRISKQERRAIEQEKKDLERRIQNELYDRPWTRYLAQF